MGAEAEIGAEVGEKSRRKLKKARDLRLSQSHREGGSWASLQPGILGLQGGTAGSGALCRQTWPS